MKHLLFFYFTLLASISMINGQFTFQKLLYSTTNIPFVSSDPPNYIYNSKILQTTDDGYLVSGRLDNLFGSEKTVLMKSDPSGNIEWVNGFNHINQNIAIYDLKKNLENGYVISTGLGWGGGIMKLDAYGDTLWTRHFDDLQALFSVDNTLDSGYIAAGYTHFFVNSEIILMKFNADGDTLWTRSYTISGMNNATAFVRQTSDGGYIITGTINAGIYMLKVDQLGNTVWCKLYSDNINNQEVFSMDTTNDGGYILCGTSNNNLYVLKTDSFGDTLWSKTLEATVNVDICYSVRQLSSGGYILGGKIDKPMWNSDAKMTFFKLDQAGEVVWAKSSGIINENKCTDVIETSDGGLALTGFYSDFIGYSNVPLFKTDHNGNVCNGDFLPINLLEISSNIMVTAPSVSLGNSSYSILNNVYFTGNYPFISSTTYGQTVPEICLVTVDSTSLHNLVVWEKPISASIDSFLVYREVGSNYIQIGSVPYDSLSQYLDSDIGIDPNVTSYRYKIAQVDTCGNTSSLSDYHETIHLTANLGVNDEVNLIWDTYEGFSFGQYNILRDSTFNGDWELLGSVTFNNISYSDFNPPLSGARYMIEVIPSITCTSTKAVDHNSSRSNRDGYSEPGGGNPGQSINQFPNGNLGVYPNPTNSTFTLELNQIQLPCVIALKDIQGRVVYSAVANTKKLQLDLSSYEKGVYFIGVVNNNLSSYIKVVKN
jgi:hypothetical protein